MTPKQLINIIALARIGLQSVISDKSFSEESVAELAADLVAGKQFAATYSVPVDPEKSP